MDRVIAILIIILFSASTSTFAQKRSISGILEDITFQDIDGVVHRPYDYLEEGKSVIIDIFATWCGPCWDYHEDGHLQQIYEIYGPDGSDDVMVFYVEGDLNTTLEDLAGEGNNTLGNYITCAPYPLVNDHYFPFDLGITNFPTQLFICPDKEITEIAQLSTDELSALIFDHCPNPDMDNNMDLLYFSSDQDPTCGFQEYLPTVIAQNNGKNSISHVSLSYAVNGSIIADSIGFDIFLNPYETVELPFPITPIESSTDFDIEIITVNHNADIDTDKNAIAGSKINILAETSEIEIQIETDHFGYEIYWTLTDENGFFVAWGGNDLVIPGGQQGQTFLTQGSNYYPSNTLIHEFAYLYNNGCYTFRIIDDWGDGLCCSSEAGFKIMDIYGSDIIQNVSYLDEYTVTFEFTGGTQTSTDQTLLTPNAVYPNPATDLIQVDFSTDYQGSADFSIVNAQGMVVAQFEQSITTGANHLVIDTKDLIDGAYFLISNLEAEQLSIPFQIFR